MLNMTTLSAIAVSLATVENVTKAVINATKSTTRQNETWQQGRLLGNVVDDEDDDYSGEYQQTKPQNRIRDFIDNPNEFFVSLPGPHIDQSIQPFQGQRITTQKTSDVPGLPPNPGPGPGPGPAPGVPTTEPPAWILPVSIAAGLLLLAVLAALIAWAFVARNRDDSTRVVVVKGQRSNTGSQIGPSTASRFGAGVSSAKTRLSGISSRTPLSVRSSLSHKTFKGSRASSRASSRPSGSRIANSRSTGRSLSLLSKRATSISRTPSVSKMSKVPQKSSAVFIASRSRS